MSNTPIVMDIEIFYKQITAYLEGNLSKAEKAAFEAALKTDIELQAALQKHQLADATLKAIEEDKYVRGLAEKAREKVEKKVKNLF